MEIPPVSSATESFASGNNLPALAKELKRAIAQFSNSIASGNSQDPDFLQTFATSIQQLAALAEKGRSC